jgi:hypothetical protein
LIENALEVLTGLFIGPILTPWGKGFEVKLSGLENVAAITGSVSRTLLQENGFDFGLEGLKVKRVR